MSKPQKYEGYGDAEAAIVEMTALTMATIIGNLSKDTVVVGGMVPRLLIDNVDGPPELPHCGSNDLDVGMSIALLEQSRWTASDF